MQRRALELSLILLGLAAAPAAAAPLQWEIRGTVTSISGEASLLEGRFALGMPLTGVFGWDTDLKNINPPHSFQGEYVSEPGLLGPRLSVSLDGETFVADPADSAKVIDYSTGYSCFDGFDIEAGAASIESSFPSGQSGLEILLMNFAVGTEVNCEVVQGTALPTEIDLAPFEWARVVTVAFSDGSASVSVTAAIESLTPLPGPPIEVEVDIRPHREVNVIAPLGRGVIPVAILGAEAFDVADVDAATLTFGPDEAQPVHPVDGRLADVSGDGISDLVLRFRTQDSGIAFGDTEACVRGELYDATPIQGCDEIVTAPACGLGFELALVLPPLMAAYGRRRRRGPK